ncbi:MAG: dockerin type I repeat-containing protein [Clostridia bacterium]|nr:dockerin type I repeat-containing protein [Clostridia bacterium]
MKKTLAVFIILLLLSVLPVKAAQEWTLGDVNADGRISASDARLVLRRAARLEEFETARENAADADRSGRVTASDARLLLRVAARLETLPADETTRVSGLTEASEPPTLPGSTEIHAQPEDPDGDGIRIDPFRWWTTEVEFNRSRYILPDTNGTPAEADVLTEYLALTRSGCYRCEYTEATEYSDDSDSSAVAYDNFELERDGGDVRVRRFTETFSVLRTAGDTYLVSDEHACYAKVTGAVSALDRIFMGGDLETVLSARLPAPGTDPASFSWGCKTFGENTADCWTCRTEDGIWEFVLFGGAVRWVTVYDSDGYFCSSFLIDSYSPDVDSARLSVPAEYRLLPTAVFFGVSVW